jgi:glycine cleavage system aminomethyltransferase T
VPAGTRLYRQTAARRSPEGNGESGEPDAWRDLGVVTTWAYSFAFGCGAVLAYVKRGHQEPGTRFRLGAGPQSVTVEPVAAVPG